MLQGLQVTKLAKSTRYLLVQVGNHGGIWLKNEQFGRINVFYGDSFNRSKQQMREGSEITVVPATRPMDLLTLVAFLDEGVVYLDVEARDPIVAWRVPVLAGYVAAPVVSGCGTDGKCKSDLLHWEMYADGDAFYGVDSPEDVITGEQLGARFAETASKCVEELDNVTIMNRLPSYLRPRSDKE